ncbi:TraK domain-containing protein [Ideonella sp. YS5]|uniref:TraK domain-containing protein n=1 Tax=Ideonella sp. YS5 TaxID=3453714 RepID=UPI003EEE3565
MRSELLAVVLAGLAIGGSDSALAAQTLDVRDGDTALARISLRDQTRIRVDRGRITEVLGDIHDAATNPAGRIALVRDDADGEVYVKPMPASAGWPSGPEAAPAPVTASAPVKLDIKTDRGTFALLLQPADVVGDTLVLRPLGSVRALPEGEPRKASAHARSVKALTLAMVSPGQDGAPKGTPVVGGGREVALWREARFMLREVQHVPGLVGETYELTNVSGKRMVIDERELYRDGVVAVAVKRLTLAPGEATPVWLVRQDPQE